jgi:hypothetical protein
VPQIAGGLFRRNARHEQPLAMPGYKTKFLKIKPTRRRQLLMPLAMPDKTKSS